MGLINIPDRPRIFKPIGMPQIDWDDPLNRGLVGHWGMFPYEFGGKVIHDLSGNGYNGTLIADTHFVPGKFGSALDFGGTGYVEVPTLNITNSLTVIAWVYSTDFSQNAFIALENPVNTIWGLFLGAEGVKLRGGSTTTTTGSLPSNSQYHQLVGVISGTSGKVYIDGVIEGVGDVLAIGTGTGLVNFGRFDDAYYFTGKIDHILIYNRALSASEIAELYRRPF